MSDPKKEEQVKQSLLQQARTWGGTSISLFFSSVLSARQISLCSLYRTKLESNTLHHHHLAYLLKLYIENPIPPTLLATLVFAQHARPLQGVPMIFPPLLLFSTYLNLQGYKIDSAGTTAALSGTYLLLASRRRLGFVNKFGARGVIRGATMGLCLVNVVGGGIAYAFGSRSKEDDKRI